MWNERSEIEGAKMSTNRRRLRGLALLLSLALCTNLLIGCGKKEVANGLVDTSAENSQTAGTSSGIHAGKTK